MSGIRARLSGLTDQFMAAVKRYHPVMGRGPGADVAEDEADHEDDERIERSRRACEPLNLRPEMFTPILQGRFAL